MTEASAPAAPMPPDPGNCSLTDVIGKERELLASTDAPAGAPIGLAFSGGGIRSATFNLGIIQALADCRLLSKFHYLSTVSGGGYIGSWLSALIHRSGEWPRRAHRVGARRDAGEFPGARRALRDEGGGARRGSPRKRATRCSTCAATRATSRRAPACSAWTRSPAWRSTCATCSSTSAVLFLSFVAVLLVPYLVADLAGIVEGSLALAVLLVAVCAFFTGLGMGEPFKGGLWTA